VIVELRVPRAGGAAGTVPDYPGEPLVIRRNPDLAPEHLSKREKRPDTTERDLLHAVAQVRRRRPPPAARRPPPAGRRQAATGFAAGAVIALHEMSKHSSTGFIENSFASSHDVECAQHKRRIRGSDDGLLVGNFRVLLDHFAAMTLELIAGAYLRSAALALAPAPTPLRSRVLDLLAIAPTVVQSGDWLTSQFIGCVGALRSSRCKLGRRASSVRCVDSRREAVRQDGNPK
jgi:hypothetical protein